MTSERESIDPDLRGPNDVLAAALGVEASPHRVMCQMKGDSLRLPIRPFLEALGRVRR